MMVVGVPDVQPFPSVVDDAVPSFRAAAVVVAAAL